MVKIIILDFDGIVVESVGIKTKAFKEMFKDQPDIAKAFLEYHLKNNGKSRFDKFEWLYKNILKEKLTESKKKELGEYFSGLVLEQVINCPYVEGAIEFLEFYNNKIPLYVVSITPPDELDKIFEKRGLKKYFKGVIGTTGKKSKIINQILKTEMIHPENVIFIGDTMEDYIASKETGVQFIARIKQETFDGIKINKFKDLKEIKDWLVMNLK